MNMKQHLFASSALMASLSLNAHAQQGMVPEKSLKETLATMSDVPLVEHVADGRISIDSDDIRADSPARRKVNVVVQDVNKNGVVDSGDYIVDAEIYNNDRMASLQRQEDGSYQAKIYDPKFKPPKDSAKALKDFNDAKIFNSGEAFQRAVAIVIKSP